MLLHEGGFQSVPFNTNPASYNGCVGISGPVVDIVNNTTDDVDMFITGHTHQPYNCLIDNRRSRARARSAALISNINLTLGRNGDVEKATAENIPMYADGRTPARGRRQAGQVLRGPLEGPA